MFEYAVREKRTYVEVGEGGAGGVGGREGGAEGEKGQLLLPPAPLLTHRLHVCMCRLQILAEFSSCLAALTLERVLWLLPPTRPRLYSISSSPLQAPDSVCVCAVCVMCLLKQYWLVCSPPCLVTLSSARVFFFVCVCVCGGP